MSSVFKNILLVAVIVYIILYSSSQVVSQCVTKIDAASQAK